MVGVICSVPVKDSGPHHQQVTSSGRQRRRVEHLWQWRNLIRTWGHYLCLTQCWIFTRQRSASLQTADRTLEFAEFVTPSLAGHVLLLLVRFLHVSSTLPRLQVPSKAGWLAVTVKTICNLVLDILIQQKETDEYPLCETDLGTGVLLYMLCHLWLFVSPALFFFFWVARFRAVEKFLAANLIFCHGESAAAQPFFGPLDVKVKRSSKTTSGNKLPVLHDLELMGKIFCDIDISKFNNIKQRHGSYFWFWMIS